jgi:hypothetical protein
VLDLLEAIHLITSVRLGHGHPADGTSVRSNVSTPELQPNPYHRQMISSGDPFLSCGVLPTDSWVCINIGQDSSLHQLARGYCNGVSAACYRPNCIRFSDECCPMFRSLCLLFWHGNAWRIRVARRGGTSKTRSMGIPIGDAQAAGNKATTS